MGIIYNAMRQSLNKEEKEYTSLHEDYNLISFCDFINLLELHADDGTKKVCEYLINEDKFLKLNFYTHDMTDVSASKGCTRFISHKYDTYYEYSGFKFNKELEYPTENFLEDFMLENGTRDYDDYYFWNIDDLLDLDCIADIGLNKEAFELCILAMNGNARIVLELTKQNKELMASLNELHSNAENNEVSNLLNELEAKEIKIDKQEKEIHSLLIKIEDKKQKIAADKNQPLHPRTRNNASKIIAALTSELLKMDITKPYASDSNGVIKAAIERQGNTVGKSVIGYWLEQAHENSR